jgi:peptide/nickel transport system permease protein
LYFVIWLARAAHGDFGRSIQSNQPVVDLLTSRIVPTLELSLLAALFALLVALPLGTLAAVRRGSIVDLGAPAFACSGSRFRISGWGFC